MVGHNLSWNNHVDLISSKAQGKLNVLYRTCRNINDISAKKLLYIASVRSRLECVSINNLEQVQRKATKFIRGRDYSEYERLNKLNLLRLKYRREINDLVSFLSFLRIYIS